MLNYSGNDIIKISNRLLDMRPDPIPFFRIVKNLLQMNADSPEYKKAGENIRNTKWVNILKETQLSDGTWGRFHTQDTKTRQIIPTTETGIRIALESGLDKDSAILKKTISFILDHLNGKKDWLDPPEKHDNPDAWPIEIKNISAANLALIDQYHPYLDKYWNYWSHVIKESFKTGI